MFEKLNSFFVFSAEKLDSEKYQKNELKETKKCKNCLRRIDLDYVKCPYCRSGDFLFDNN